MTGRGTHAFKESQTQCVSCILADLALQRNAENDSEFKVATRLGENKGRSANNGHRTTKKVSPDPGWGLGPGLSQAFNVFNFSHS